MTDASPLLVGDVGGTNVRFALAVAKPAGGFDLTDISKTPGDDYESFDHALEVYLSQTGAQPDAAVFALAAPINGPIAQLTNRDWCVDAGALKTHFGVNTIRLANDFAAMARSVPELSTDSFLSLKPGNADPDTPIVVAGPGTGFGMAVLVPEDMGWRVISGEGGHQAFAPQTELEWALAKRLTETHGFVTVETVTGGAFMDTVHAALCDIHGVPYKQTSPADLLVSAASGDKTALALSQIRAETTMTAVMDAVLALGARGGAVIAGGVSERLVDHLKSPQVLDRMTKRGVRSDYVADIPIRLLVDSDAPLIGAAALQR